MLRILSWNVSLSLRTRWASITEHHSDLGVLPEVARSDLESLVPDADHRLWIGDNDCKGLGLVSFGDYRLERDPCRRRDPSELRAANATPSTVRQVISGARERRLKVPAGPQLSHYG